MTSQPLIKDAPSFQLPSCFPFYLIAFLCQLFKVLPGLPVHVPRVVVVKKVVNEVVALLCLVVPMIL